MTDKITKLLESGDIRNAELAIQLSSGLDAEEKFVVFMSLLRQVHFHSPDHSQFNRALIKFAQKCLGAETLVVDSMTYQLSSDYIHIKKTCLRRIKETHYIKHSDYKIQDRLFTVIDSHQLHILQDYKIIIYNYE